MCTVYSKIPYSPMFSKPMNKQMHFPSHACPHWDRTHRWHQMIKLMWDGALTSRMWCICSWYRGVSQRSEFLRYVADLASFPVAGTKAILGRRVSFLFTVQGITCHGGEIKAAALHPGSACVQLAFSFYLFQDPRGEKWCQPQREVFSLWLTQLA